MAFRTMAGPGEEERRRMLASQSGLLTEYSTPSNNFDPQVFQHAAEIAQKNLAMQEEARQSDLQRQMQMQQMQMQERQANARGTLDHQRFKAGDRNQQRQLQQQDQRLGLQGLQESKRMGDREQMDAQWQHQTALVLDKDMSEMLKVARTIDYTPEGRRIYAQLAAEGRAVQSAKGKVRPAQWSQMAGQFMERFEQADLGSYQNAPPTIKEIYDANVMDIGNGRLMHTGQVRIDNSTNIRDMSTAATLEDGTPEPATVEGYMATQFGDKVKGPAAFEKAKKEAIADLREQWSMEPGNEDDTPPMPNSEEIMAKIRENADLYVQMQNAIRGIAPPPEEQPIASTQPGKAMSDHIRAKKERLETGEPQPDPTTDRTPGIHSIKTPEAVQATAAMKLARNPEEAMAVTQQFMSNGIARVADMPEAAKLQERMAARNIEGAWTNYMTDEAIVRQLQAGSKDPFADVLKHAEAMLSLPDGFDIKDAPLEWQKKLDEEMETVYVQAEYDNLPPGEIFIDGVTGKMVRKPVESPKWPSDRSTHRMPASNLDTGRFPGMN